MPDERLNRYADYLDSTHPPVDPEAIRATTPSPAGLDVLDEVTVDDRRPRNWVWIATAAAAVVALLLGVLAVGRSAEQLQVTDGGPEPDSNGGWIGLPSMPLDPEMSDLNNPTTLWTGSEMFISSDGRSPMFDLATGTWRLTSSPPIDAVADPITRAPVWTGSEVIVFLREALGRPATRDGEVGPLVGLAYRPTTDSWRRIAAIPAGRSFSVVAWTGSQVLTWGNFVGVTAYDPALDSWSVLTTESGTPTPDGKASSSPDAPKFPAYGSSSLWNGTELIVFPTFAGEGAAFDPATATWRALPAVPIDPGAMAWTGSEVLAFDGESGELARFFPGEASWRMATPAPLSGRAIGAAVWGGGRFAVWGGLHFDDAPGSTGPTRLRDGAAYDPASDTWASMGAMPASSPAVAGGVYAGDRVLAWGGAPSPPSLVAASWTPNE